MKKTFKEIRDFNMAAGRFLAPDPKNPEKKNDQTKLGYAIKKISEVQIKNIIKEYQTAYQEAYYENVEKKQVDLALADKVTGAVLLAPKGSDRPYMYDKAGLLAVIKAEKDFTSIGEKLLEEFDAKEFDIEPHYAVEVPKDLSDNDVEAFTGFVIAPAKE